MLWHIRDVNSTPANPKTVCGTEPKLHPIGGPESSRFPMLVNRAWVTGSMIEGICPRCRMMLEVEAEKAKEPTPF